MICYRELTAEDVPGIHQIEKESLSAPWSIDALHNMIGRTDAKYYVAEEEGIVLGGIGVMFVAGEGDITNVVVAPGARNRGIATGLLAHMLRMGDREGISEFTLEVRVSNEIAIHVYEKAGFVAEGVRPHFYEHPREDALIMWKR